MSDLFSTPDGEQLELPDADIRLFPHAFAAPEADRAFEGLLTQTTWLDKTVVVWGKTHQQPRQIAWHGDPSASYGYAGTRVDPLPWTPLLLSIRKRVEELAQCTFNSVLLNHYRNGDDNLGMHSDNEPELGSTPTIASLSLGETRDFQLRHRTRKDLKLCHILLNHGSLLIMAGTTQQHWVHGLRRETKALGPRVNLTFRRIFSRER